MRRLLASMLVAVAAAPLIADAATAPPTAVEVDWHQLGGGGTDGWSGAIVHHGDRFLMTRTEQIDTGRLDEDGAAEIVSSTTLLSSPDGLTWAGGAPLAGIANLDVIGLASDETTLWAAGGYGNPWGQDPPGPMVMSSTDGGATWTLEYEAEAALRSLDAVVALSITFGPDGAPVVLGRDSAGGPVSVTVATDGWTGSAVEVHVDGVDRTADASLHGIEFIDGRYLAVGSLEEPTGVTAATFIGDGAGVFDLGATVEGIEYLYDALLLQGDPLFAGVDTDGVAAFATAAGPFDPARVATASGLPAGEEPSSFVGQLATDGTLIVGAGSANWSPGFWEITWPS